MLLQRVQPDGPRLRLLLDDHLGAGPRLLRLADRPHPLPNLRHPPPVQGLLRWVRPSHRHRLRGNSSTPRLCRERRRRDSHVLINPCLSNSFRPPYPSMTIVDALSFITFCCAKHFSNCYSFLYAGQSMMCWALRRSLLYSADKCGHYSCRMRTEYLKISSAATYSNRSIFSQRHAYLLLRALRAYYFGSLYSAF